MGTIAFFLGQLVGSIIAVYATSRFMNFVFYKITKSDTKQQKIIASIAGTLIAVFISTAVSLSLKKNVYDIMGGELLYVFGGLVTIFKFALNLRNKYIWLAIAYSLIFYIIIGILTAIIAYAILPNIEEGNLHVINFVFYITCLMISSILVVGQKLPYTKYQKLNKQ